MHATASGRYGWHFFVTKPDGSRDHYTIESLDRSFELGIKGSAWEANVLASQVARMARAEVEATFNGVLIAAASAV
jgi:hypothetical protein